MDDKLTLKNLLDERKYNNNKTTILDANFSFYNVFNKLMIFLLTILYISTFFSNYARSMRYVYLFFILWSLMDILILNKVPTINDRIKSIVCFIGVFKAYLFCIFTSVIYNVSNEAITFYVFLIILPVCFVFKFKQMLVIQILAVITFSTATLIYKDPELIFSEILACLIFFFISLVMAIQANKNRVDNYDIYRITNNVEKRNKDIFDNTPCGIYELTFNNKKITISFINKEGIKLFGYNEEEFYQKEAWAITDFVYQDDLPLVYNSLQNPYIGKTLTYNFRLLNNQTKKYTWVGCKVLITKIKGTKITVLTSLLDIHEKKITESASEAKSRFLSTISHEIRTPINAIMGISALTSQELENDNPDLTVIKKYINETVDSTMYLLTLVNDILDTSRIENNKLILHNELVNTKEFLQNINNLIEPMAKAKEIEFTFTRETFNSECYIGDSIRAQQILVNILNNAIKFTPRKGKVSFIARCKSKTNDKTILEFIISDNGIGMKKEFQKDLFKPFSREESNTTTPFSGTGLGLNIAKTLANKMNGDITFTSEYQKGTTFYVTMEVGNTDKKIEKILNTYQNTSNWDFTGIKILLCEDHPLNQKIATKLLEKHGCIVEIAENGVEGLKMFSSNPVGYYSMIFMDIRMPLMDGLEATTKIRELDKIDAQTIPIVAMSANAYDEDVKNSLLSGMNDHIAKPVDSTLLYNTVARFTGNNYIKPIVLVVDDIDMNIDIITKIINNDYNVIKANNGQVALDKLEEYQNIVAVITDIQMPVMDGIELITKIRSNYKYDNIAILANTQYDMKDITVKLLEIGADDFVYKPVSPIILANRLRSVIFKYSNSHN